MPGIVCSQNPSPGEHPLHPENTPFRNVNIFTRRTLSSPGEHSLHPENTFYPVWVPPHPSEGASQALCLRHAPPGYWLLAFGYRLLAIGYSLLAIGYWLLAIGYWYWLLATGVGLENPFTSGDLQFSNPGFSVLWWLVPVCWWLFVGGSCF